MQRFAVGDRVRIMDTPGVDAPSWMQGETGVIVLDLAEDSWSPALFGVEFDERMEGCTSFAEYNLPDKEGYYFYPREMELIDMSDDETSIDPFSDDEFSRLLVGA